MQAEIEIDDYEIEAAIESAIESAIEGYLQDYDLDIRLKEISQQIEALADRINQVESKMVQKGLYRLQLVKEIEDE